MLNLFTVSNQLNIQTLHNNSLNLETMILGGSTAEQCNVPNLETMILSGLTEKQCNIANLDTSAWVNSPLELQLGELANNYLVFSVGDY